MSDLTELVGVLILGPLATAGWLAVWRFARSADLLTGKPLSADEARIRQQIVVLTALVVSAGLFLVGLTSAITVVLVLGGFGLPLYGVSFWVAISIYYSGIAIWWILIPYAHYAAPIALRKSVELLTPKPVEIPPGAYLSFRAPGEPSQQPWPVEPLPSPSEEQM